MKNFIGVDFMLAVNQIQLKILILIQTFHINMMIAKGKKDIVDSFET